jgi:hypothetical protein
MTSRFSVHQQAFRGLSLNLPCLTDPAVYTAQFISSIGFKYRQLGTFLAESAFES